jgi:diguanylate cyclase (GGDEF)-like protein
MTDHSLLVLMICFCVFTVIWTRVWFFYHRRKWADDLSRYQKRALKLQQRHELKMQERQELEDRASQMLTLFEMTKSITKAKNESEAFEIFEKNLMTHVQFSACRLVDVHNWDLDTRKSDTFVFPIKDNTKTVSLLVVDGVSPSDHETISILGHQFALAFRRVRLYEYIERISITDELTNVHTRRYWNERFYEELLRSQENRMAMSLLMLDVDYFKSFNDRYGHLVGDEILRQIGQLIKSHLRTIDIPGRFGGEEFCVVLPETDAQGAALVAERIRRATEDQNFRAYDNSLTVTISVGVAAFPEHGESSNMLMERVDWALYQAKKEGRNRVAIYHE